MTTAERWDKMIEIIENNNMSAEDVLRLLTDWHGMQIITDEFIEELQE